MKRFSFIVAVFVVVVALFLTVGAVVYYFGFYLPRLKDQARIAAETSDYYTCLENVDNIASDQVADFCKQSTEMYQKCTKDSPDSQFCSFLGEAIYTPNCRI